MKKIYRQGIHAAFLVKVNRPTERLSRRAMLIIRFLRTSNQQRYFYSITGCLSIGAGISVEISVEIVRFYTNLYEYSKADYRRGH